MSFWTPEREQELRVLWSQGLTGSEIGRALGATRQAIGAKADRLRLCARKDAPVSGRPIGGGSTLKTSKPVTPEYEAMLRRVAKWDSAAAHGLAVLERQRAGHV